MQNVLVTREGRHGPVAPRLQILFSREASVAVIFRRGPTAWTQMIRWNTADDTFEPGQWFRGRIYDRRSDLSPDGSLLLYFARKINGRTLADKKYTDAWTAVSKPPYFTALALWPKGDCWHGGGLFFDGRTIELNHASDRTAHHPNHAPGRHLRVKFRSIVMGEDEPIYTERLERDGWKLISGSRLSNFISSQEELRLKKQRGGDLCVALKRSYNTRPLRYFERFEVQNRELGLYAEVQRADWVDFDQRGRLIVAQDGRISTANLTEEGLVMDGCLANFTANQPEQVPPAAWAASW